MARSGSEEAIPEVVLGLVEPSNIIIKDGKVYKNTLK
jgi:hypothetical protein